MGHSARHGWCKTQVLGALLVLGVLLLPASAAAHVPTIETDEAEEQGAPVPIGGPEKSRAIYGFLESGTVDSYAFETTEPLTRTVRIIIPDYPEHQDFRPTLVMESDGVEVVRAEESADAERASEFEPFSLTSFVEGAEATYDFEPGRVYVLRVEPGSGDARSGRYVVVVGGPEEFTGGEIATTLRDLPAIWFGAYGGAPLRWNWLATIPLGFLAALVGVLVYAVVQAARSKKRSTIPG